MQKPGQVLSWQDGWQPRAPWGVSFSKRSVVSGQQWPREDLKDGRLWRWSVFLWFPWDFLDDSCFPLSGRWKCFRKKSSLVINSLSSFLTSQARLMGWAGWHRKQLGISLFALYLSTFMLMALFSVRAAAKLGEMFTALKVFQWWMMWESQE